MYSCRNHIGNIYFEFLKHPTSKKCFIICEGILCVNPSKEELMYSLYQHGYSSIAPRYEGTRESKGEFLTHPPAQDIIQVLQHFQTTVVQGAYEWEIFDFREEEYILLGANLGGTVALQIAETHDFKTIALSPAIHIDKKTTASEKSNVIFVGRYLQEGFGNAYRFSNENRKKFAEGAFFQVAAEKLKKRKENILIISDKEDVFIRQTPIDILCATTGIKNRFVKHY
jgi:esterase/lipase